MSRIMGVVVALATAATVLTGATAGSAPPEVAADLPRDIPDGVEVTLADGDTFRVWTSRNHRTVRSTRRDAATGTWGDPRVVLREEDLFCGDVDVRTAAGAVAITAECDLNGYAEDQAPTASRALWSADTLTWSAYELEGEAYEEPGISPDGTQAVWPEAGGYVTRTAAGFTRRQLDTRGREYTTTATITDAAQVSYLYGAASGGRCQVVVLSRTGDGPTTRQELPLADGCQDAGFENVDADTAWFGDLDDPAGRSTISRADASSPWVVSEVAPAYAPGLMDHGRGRLSTDFFQVPGLPLLALGAAPRGRRLHVQSYDATSQTWGPRRLAYDAGAGRTCRWGDTWIDPPLQVMAVELRCGTGRVVLTTADGVAWRALRMRQNTWGFSPDGRYVAVPARTVTHVISVERGVVTLPGGVRGRCDVVVPDGPDAAVLLTAARRDRGWPTILRTSSADGWQGRTRTGLPTPSPTCRDARAEAYDLPYRFAISSRWKGYVVRVVERDGGWTVRRSRF